MATKYNIWVKTSQNNYRFGGITTGSSPEKAIKNFHDRNSNKTQKYMATPTINTHYDTVLE